MNWLLDFYGAMLTERQKNALELHYSDDLSLSEISDKLNITRQAVHDSLKRGEKLLDTYEEKLGLVKRYFDIGHKIQSINEKAKSLSSDIKHEQLYNEILDLVDSWNY